MYLSSDAPTALASNAAFICLFAAELGIRPNTYRKFAQGQLNYILGLLKYIFRQVENCHLFFKS